MSGWLKAALIAALAIFLLVVPNSIFIATFPIWIVPSVWYIAFIGTSPTEEWVSSFSLILVFSIALGLFIQRIWTLLMGALSNFKLGMQIIRKTKLLCFVIITVLGMNIFILFGNSELATLVNMSVYGLIIQSAKFLGFAVAFVFLIAIALEIIKQKRREDGRNTWSGEFFETSDDLVRFSIFYNIHNSTDRVMDVLMILLINQYGFWKEMIIAQPLSFLLCVLVIQAHDRIEREDGNDLLRIAKLRNYQGDKKFLRWILSSRKLIFLVGSLVQLDSDVVCLLLRKKEGDYRIALASSVYSITIWSLIYLLGTEAYVRWLSLLPNWIQSWIAN